MTSTVKPVASCSVTVRQTPLTAMEAPCVASLTTSGPSMRSTAESAAVLDGGDGAELLDDSGEHVCLLRVLRALADATWSRGPGSCRCRWAVEAVGTAWMRTSPPTTVTSTRSRRRTSSMDAMPRSATAARPAPSSAGAT